jgi:hypothetical protein
VKRVLTIAPWVLLLGFAVLEVTAHAVTRRGVAPRQDWRAAARFVRAQWRPRDLVVAAPTWADPVLREVLGDRIDLAMAGRSDDARYERLWAVSIRGARPREAGTTAPTLTKRLGGVTVMRFALGPSPVRYDFVEHLREAAVALVWRGKTIVCGRQHHPEPGGGGLGFGVLPPPERFGCGLRSTTWVAPVVLEDLDLTARHCIYTPPAGPGPLRVTFRDVPLGERIVFYGGLYYEHERMREGGPVLARVLVNGRELGNMTHRDGDGWKRLALPTHGGRGDVTVEVSAQKARQRSFCWTASVREGSERRSP